jgi:N-acetylmuramic acid 6-phosphate etherase
VSTEGSSRDYAGIDLWPTADIVAAMFDGQVAATAAVGAQVEAIAAAADEAAERLARGSGRLVYVGAGTSGRLAVLDGTELEPTFGWSRDRLVYAIAGGMAALSASVEGAEDDEDSGRARILQSAVGADDVVIGVSASGTTPYTVAALAEAAAAGALTIGIACNPDTPLLAGARHPILLNTAAEIVSGSTRMKAGTAQKIALNLLSTAIMIRLGHVHDGLMVDMRVSNRKLRRRAVAIVAEISGAGKARAESALDLAGNAIKPAVLIALGLSAEEAAQRLGECGNNLRQALEGLR